MERGEEEDGELESTFYLDQWTGSQTGTTANQKLQFGAGANAGLEENLAAAQQQMQVMQQLHKTTEMCWDLCVGTPSSSLSSREEACLNNCVGRFIDTTLLITNRFSQLAQKMQR